MVTTECALLPCCWALKNIPRAGPPATVITRSHQQELRVDTALSPGQPKAKPECRSQLLRVRGLGLRRPGPQAYQ